MKYKRIRSGAIVLKKGKILLYQRPKGYWYFPGGGVENGETLEKAAVRETLEETGMKIKLQKFLYAREWDSLRKKTLELIYLAKPVGGKMKIGKDVSGGETKDLRWIPINEIKKYWVATPDIFRIFQKDLKVKFKNSPCWIGRAKFYHKK